MAQDCSATSCRSAQVSAVPKAGRVMSAPRELLQQLLERRDLTQAQAQDLLAQLADRDTPPALAGALLAALAANGVVAEELRGVAQATRPPARRPPPSRGRSTASARARTGRGASTFPPAARCSPRPAVCPSSSTATARSRAAVAARTCWKPWGLPFRSVS